MLCQKNNKDNHNQLRHKLLRQHHRKGLFQERIKKC